MKKNEKGFTLVEMLAVIVIIGLVMTIAVVSVTGYIEKSRRDTYISIAREYITIASNKIAQQKLIVRDSNTVYYIHINNLETETKKSGSPFGADWNDAYVVVTIEPETNNFTYYWTSVDKKGYRVELTKDADLENDSIYLSNDLTIRASYPIGGRDNIVVYDKDGNRTNDIPSIEVSLEEAEKCYDWEEDADGKITITGYDVSCGTDISIPSVIDGKPVVAIGNGAFKNKNLTNVNMYKGIATIGYGAFQGNKLNTVKLSQSVVAIGDYAFYNSKISNLIMSDGVKTIGEYAFASNNICEVDFPKSLKSLGNFAFDGNCLTYISLPAGLKVNVGTFSNNDVDDSSAFIYERNADGSPNYSTLVGYAGNNINNIKIPAERNGVPLKRISSSAFGWMGLTGSITIPDTVTYIGSDAFAGNKIENVILPEGLETISAGAFRNNRLTSIDIPDSVTNLGNYAFNNNKIYGEEGIIYARNKDGTTNYSTIVGYAGGYYNKNEASPTTITIPATKYDPVTGKNVTLTLISSNAFLDANLTEINLPSLSEVPNLTISDNAFRRNNIPNSFTNDYCNGAFCYLVKNGVIYYDTLSSYAGPSSGDSKNGNIITIPESYKNTSLKNINASFTWMSYSKIVIPSTVKTIADGIFTKSGSNNQSLTTIVNKTGREFDWKNLTGSSYTNNFVTGTILHQAGNIEVVSE